MVAHTTYKNWGWFIIVLLTSNRFYVDLATKSGGLTTRNGASTKANRELKQYRGLAGTTQE